VFGGVVELISMLLLALMTNVHQLSFLLSLQYFVYLQIFLFFIGNEAVIVGGMILNVQLVAPEKQGRASGLISFANSATNFVSILIAGPLYYYDGMSVQSLIMLALVLLQISGILWFFCKFSSRHTETDETRTEGREEMKKLINNTKNVNNYSSTISR